MTHHVSVNNESQASWLLRRQRLECDQCNLVLDPKKKYFKTYWLNSAQPVNNLKAHLWNM